MSEENNKFYEAIKILRPNTEMAWGGKIETEEDFNKVQWKIGEDEYLRMIYTTTCPHSEITWTKVSEEMSKL